MRTAYVRAVIRVNFDDDGKTCLEDLAVSSAMEDLHRLEPEDVECIEVEPIKDTTHDRT